MRRSRRELAAAALEALRLGPLLRRIGAWNGLLVLNYHRIGDGYRSQWDEDLFSATAEDFAAQLRFLKSQFDVIDAKDLDEVLARPKGRFVQITFDDGYRDNFEIAFPILRDAGVSATFFVTSNFIDTGRVPWWDELAWMARRAARSRLPWKGLASPFGPRCDRRDLARSLNRAYSALPDEARPAFLDSIGEATGTGRCRPAEGASLWMTWDMVRHMRDAGMVIGGHTVHHLELSRLPRAAQLAEIAGCKARIQAELGEPIESFAYPFGRLSSFDATSRACLAEAGFRYAYSYYGGFQRAGAADAHDLKRVAIESYQSEALLRAIATVPSVLA